MIELRFPTPEESNLKMLNEFSEGESLEVINRGNYVYLQVPKCRLARFNRFVTENEIAKAEDIEEILSFDFPISPPEKIPLLVNFLNGIIASFTVSAYIKISKKDFELLTDFLSKNGFEEM